MCASQDLNDFFTLDYGKYGKGIINNSKTKIILNLEVDEAQRVQPFINLPEGCCWSQMAEEDPLRRLVVVDSEEQIASIDIPSASGFCTVDGQVTYFKKE